MTSHAETPTPVEHSACFTSQARPPPEGHLLTGMIELRHPKSLQSARVSHVRVWFGFVAAWSVLLACDPRGQEEGSCRQPAAQNLRALRACWHRLLIFQRRKPATQRCHPNAVGHREPGSPTCVQVLACTHFPFHTLSDRLARLFWHQPAC